MTEEVKEKSDAENIVEREFASLRTQLEEAATLPKGNQESVRRSFKAN